MCQNGLRNRCHWDGATPIKFRLLRGENTHLLDGLRQCATIIVGIARQTAHADHQTFLVRGGDGDLDAELIQLAYLAFGNAHKPAKTRSWWCRCSINWPDCQNRWAKNAGACEARGIEPLIAVPRIFRQKSTNTGLASSIILTCSAQNQQAASRVAFYRLLSFQAFPGPGPLPT